MIFFYTHMIVFTIYVCLQRQIIYFKGFLMNTCQKVLIVL